MTSQKSKTAVLIAGPTASGKSALAMRIAADRGGVIINADSMQIYRELRVLTARPLEEEELIVPHRLYGTVSGMADFSVGQWLAEARREIQSCWEAGSSPVITGGTGLYFKVLEDGLADIPPIPADVKAYWREFEGNLHDMLLRRDPVMGRRLNSTDKHRVIRALEVHDVTGRSLAWWQEQGHAAAMLNGVDVERIYVSLPREELHERAALRFDKMLAQGALEEVRSLPVLDPRMPIMKAIGVPELQAHLAGVLTLDQAREKAISATRQYIKRQSTWWRGQMPKWTEA